MTMQNVKPEMPPLRDFWVIPVFFGGLVVLSLFMVLFLLNLANIFVPILEKIFLFFGIWALIGFIWMIIDFIIHMREGSI